MKYKKIIIGKYMVEQLENFTVQICNMCTGQIVAWWENEEREFSEDELECFYEYYKANKQVAFLFRKKG